MWFGIKDIQGKQKDIRKDIKNTIAITLDRQ